MNTEAATQTARLRLLDELSLSREIDLVSELFHRINRVIPENQKLFTIEPKTPARDALAQMLDFGYSQVPVKDGGEVLGVFSYRSFARRAANPSLQELTQQKYAPGDLPVEEYLEQFQFARINDEMRSVFTCMDRDNGVLIGSPDKLKCILTPMDFLHYLYRVAAPFVLISEIELTLRALIKLAVSDEELVACTEKCLSQLYGAGNVPKTLEEMTVDNYKMIISHRDNWTKFENTFGNNRNMTAAKIKEIADLRNDVFHFKRELTKKDHSVLTDHREWLLRLAKQSNIRRKKGDS